jgi:hypothetical protein
LGAKKFVSIVIEAILTSEFAMNHLGRRFVIYGKLDIPSAG